MLTEPTNRANAMISNSREGQARKQGVEGARREHRQHLSGSFDRSVRAAVSAVRFAGCTSKTLFASLTWHKT